MPILTPPAPTASSISIIITHLVKGQYNPEAAAWLIWPPQSLSVHLFEVGEAKLAPAPTHAMLAPGEPLRTWQTPAWVQQAFSHSGQSAKPWHSNWCGRPGDRRWAGAPTTPSFPNSISSSCTPTTKVLRSVHSAHLRPDTCHGSSKANASQTWKKHTNDLLKMQVLTQ